MRVALVLVAALAATCSCSPLFVEEGKEYEFYTTGGVGAGTMDYATHTAGYGFRMKTILNVNGKQLTLRFSDMEFTQYVGGHESNEWPYDESDKVKYTSSAAAPKPFQINLDENGLFKELVVPSDANVFQKNLMRAWAAQLQINTGKIKAGERGFKSKEKMLQGNCEVTYSVTEDAVRKSVSHMDDCDDRVFRLINDYRGQTCRHDHRDHHHKGEHSEDDDHEDDHHSGLDYPASTATTVFLVEKKSGGGFQINAIISTGTFVAQFFEEEGSSQFVHSNMTSKLVAVRSGSGPSVSGETITDLGYEFNDKEYAWNKDRDLKAKEPLVSSGLFLSDDSATVKEAVKKGLAFQKTLLDTHSNDNESIQKAHRYGINSILPAMFALDYDTLKSLATELFDDKSEDGVMKANLFAELLGSTGTSAAALLIRDFVIEGKFDNHRDAARVLTAVPFHIRRPNTQLVKEYEKLLEFRKSGSAERFVEMAIPLTFGHLVRITCERAGQPHSPENVDCFKNFASTYAKKALEKYKAATDIEDKITILDMLANMRYGGQSELLKPIVNGEIDGEDWFLRTKALFASGYEIIARGKGADTFLPIFANRKYEHELRIAALELLFKSHPSASELSSVLSVLFKESDYEVLNYAFTLFERWASSINPCDTETKNLAKYYLKFMKQYSEYETDYGFGVSKTFMRQYWKNKYGYGGGYLYYVVGSHESTTPIKVGMAMTSTVMGMRNHMLSAHFRIEGLAKAIVRKFKTMDPAVWKTDDLHKILTGDMGIRERPDEPVRVHVQFKLKGVTVFSRYYDESDTGKDGKLGSLVEKFQNLEETYTINHQRAINLGGLMYEQPTNLGLPMAVISSMTTMVSLKATVKRGNHRGLLFRDVTYDAHVFTQAVRAAIVANPLRKTAYSIVNDRIYQGHFPRKFVIGVNPIKKELKLSISRPAYDDPLMIMMHSQTTVRVRGDNLKGDYQGLQDNCPSCQNAVIVSRGPDAIKSRVFIDKENQKLGSYLHGEYFDCEMDTSKGNTIGHLVAAFTPYNKNPKTAWTAITMGIRQIRAFFLHFPKTEKCGAMLRWSQSKTNPVSEIEIALRGEMEKNGERMFFRGRKWFIKALIKAKGEPEDRSYRINLAYEFTPGNLENKIKLQVNRAPIAALNMDPYVLCFALENKYPDFSKEFLSYDESTDMTVTGKAMLQYGVGTGCEEGDGEIKAKFKHSTTQAARKDMKDTWYYKKCMEQKTSPAWSAKKGLPVSEACYLTVYDATTARKYTWDIEFVKLTARAKRIIGKVQTAAKAGLLPYWDVDPEDNSDDSDGNIGPYLNIDATFKNHDTALDIHMETTHGEEDFKDIPLRLDWTKKLRNLKFTNTLKKLFDARILNPCIVTSETIHTCDNVTMSYTPNTCWTLTSGHCAPNPNYAVFTKKSGSGLPLAAKVFIGGHTVEFVPTGSNGVDVKLNGNSAQVPDQKEVEHTVDGTELFKIFRWGNTYNVYSFLKVWVAYDGYSVEVVPMPSAKGQHCGICGNFNRNKFDELEGKDHTTHHKSVDEFVADYKWQC